MPETHQRTALRKEALKRNGYRFTSGRKAVLDILGRTHDHLSANDIFVALHPSYPHLGLTTVYRTLDLLANLDLVIRFDFGDGRSRFELAEKVKGDRHHHHLICTGCRKIIDYRDFHDKEMELIEATQKKLARRYRFKISNHLMQFFGLCEQCAKRK
ncbi:transcriptional repressor [bacterium]|nr:transcriptional repressor [bacterium]